MIKLNILIKQMIFKLTKKKKKNDKIKKLIEQGTNILTKF